MPDVAFGGAFTVGRAESFCAWPNPADDSRHRSGSACVSECVHRTTYGLDESHSLIGTASRSEKDQRAAGTQPLKIHACE